jgi:FkbM family methyltransferase
MLRLVRRIKSMLVNPDRFLRDARGVIHAGANTGQERDIYAAHNLDVLWLEPIPQVFEVLSENIRDLPRQRAIQALVTDKDGETYDFHVATNGGASSSILDLDLHRDIWPDVTYDHRLILQSHTLDTLLQVHSIDPAGYDALVMDTQGSELLVLKGSTRLLPRIKFIKTEAADFQGRLPCRGTSRLPREPRLPGALSQ